MQFDSAREIVNITGYSSPSGGASNYDTAESSQKAVNSVLVEVDKFDNLRAAYPNYFLDVSAFTNYLNRIVQGKEMIPPQAPSQGQVVRPANDLSWLADYRRPSRRHS